MFALLAYSLYYFARKPLDTLETLDTLNTQEGVR